MGLKRVTILNTATGIHESIAFADAVLMRELGMDYGTDDVEWFISYPEPDISTEDQSWYTDIDELTSQIQNHRDSLSGRTVDLEYEQ